MGAKDKRRPMWRAAVFCADAMLDRGTRCPRASCHDAMERRYIREVLEATGGNRTEAARFLRIDYKTLMRKL